MNVCKRILAVILSIVVLLAMFPISNTVFAEEISSSRIFEDNFDDESSLENYEQAISNAYGNPILNAADVAASITTVGEKSVLKARAAKAKNQNASDLVKNVPEGRRVESVTTTFNHSVEVTNEDSSSGIVAFQMNSRNSLVLMVFPNSSDEYVYYSWCRFSYGETGASNVSNNCIEIYKDQVTNVRKWRYSTNLVGDNTDWLTVTLNYDYSQIEDNILTVSAILTDEEGNKGTIPSFSAKFDDTVYDCTDADGNVLESGKYMAYDENFRVGISSCYGNYSCYYDNFKVQYSKTAEEFAQDFRIEYREELSSTKVTTREQFDAVAKAKVSLEAASAEVQELLAEEKAKLSASLSTYTVSGDDFEYGNYSNEIWETVPYSGDIRTWNASTSAFASTTDSTLTSASKLVTDTLDSENTVFAPEIRSQQRKVKLKTVKEEYLKEGAMINSFSMDFRIDVNYTWDTNSGIYYYYKNPYNWARMELSLTSAGLINTRFMQNKGNDDGTEMVSTVLMNNCSLADTALGDWIGVQFDYEYLEDGTNITITFTDKATNTVIYTQTKKTTDFNVGGRVGIASANSTNSTIYYDNFSVGYTRSANDFREENAEVLSLQAITSKEQFDKVAQVKASLEELPVNLQSQLVKEAQYLSSLLSAYKILSDDFEYPNLTNEVFESLPETGDIMTWATSSSAFVSGTSSSGTKAYTTEDSLDSANNVLIPEYRNITRKRKMLTLKEEYMRSDTLMKSFSTDVRYDAVIGWDPSPGIYYYYKDVYNWGRIELNLTGTAPYYRVIEQSGTSSGEDMVSINRASNTKLSDAGVGVWFTYKLDYVYSEDSVAITLTVTDKSTGTIVSTCDLTSEYIVDSNFKVGYGASNSTAAPICFDNFELEYFKTVNEFKAENERVLSLDVSTVAISDLADVNLAISDYEALHYLVKSELAGEYSLLKALKAKIIRLQKQDTVYISSSGNDDNNGTSSNPTATFDAAVALMNKGGAIYIDGEYVVDSKFTFNSYGKDLVITGGTLDLSALSNVNFADNITFDNVTLKFKDNANVYANGYNLTINSNVTVEGTTNLFGGGASGTTVDSTNIKVLSGNYKTICGGSRQGTVLGDTNLYIGGYVNKDIVTALAHANTANIYGGGLEDTVNGSTNIIFTENALSSYVAGGGTYASSGGASGTVGGNTNIVVSGNAQTYGVYGGSKAAGTVGGDINVLIDGGAVADLFGGHGGANHEGNVYIELKKGSIDRRIWGGCYNENSGLSWATSNHVIGSIYVTVWNGFSFVFDGKDSLNSSYSDLSFYAHSRCKNQSDEISNIIYIDSSAYNSLKSKEKYHDTDFSSKIFMSSAAPSNAADNIYYCSYSASGNTITKTYNKVSGTAISNGTATIGIDESVSLEYTGEAIEAAKLIYNNWFAHSLDIAYSNNVEVGTATATISTNGVSASTTFDIYYDTTPALLGASIKKSLTQDIQFTARLPKSSKKVAEYGMAITFYNNIGNGVELSDMTADTTNEGVRVVKRVLEESVAMSQELFVLNVGKIDADKYGYRYVVRAFVRYEGESEYHYSDNTDSISQSGSDAGYISRSVISVSKSILSWVYENQNVLHNEYGVADVNAIIKKNETTGKYSWVSGITANNGEKV
ncbi:MAG: hypothetical protein IJP22_00685, partial [Clostridia bacterium]|nr:hypothetical protein [Clostridia bacterium]